MPLTRFTRPASAPYVNISTTSAQIRANNAQLLYPEDPVPMREDETTVHEVEVQDAIDWTNARPPSIDSSRSMRVAYLLAAEVVGLRADIKRLETANDVIVATNEKLAKELHHWKNNHETEVKRARILKERTDMPIERVRAYDQWGKDQQTIADLRQRIIELEGKVV